MTRSELIWKIDHGDDIMLDISGRHYAIFTWPEDGVRIVEQNTGEEGVTFSSTEKLLTEFRVNGKPLGEIAKDIKITQYTLVR